MTKPERDDYQATDRPERQYLLDLGKCLLLLREEVAELTGYPASLYVEEFYRLENHLNARQVPNDEA